MPYNIHMPSGFNIRNTSVDIKFSLIILLYFLNQNTKQIFTLHYGQFIHFLCFNLLNSNFWTSPWNETKKEKPSDTVWIKQRNRFKFLNSLIKTMVLAKQTYDDLLYYIGSRILANNLHGGFYLLNVQKRLCISNTLNNNKHV